MPAAPKSVQSKKPETPKAKGAARTKSGCYTCRIRRKKCDENPNQDGHCETCLRLRLQCLGFGAKRPEWLRESQKVSETRDKIKAFLAAQGMIKGHTGSGHYGSEYDPDLPFLKLEDENIKTPSSSERSPTTALPRVIREAPRPIGPQESAIREQRAPWIGHYHGLHNTRGTSSSPLEGSSQRSRSDSESPPPQPTSTPYTNTQPVPQGPEISSRQGARPIPSRLECSSHSDSERPSAHRTSTRYTNGEPVGLHNTRGAPPLAGSSRRSHPDPASPPAQLTSPRYTNAQPVGLRNLRGASSQRSHSDTERPPVQRIYAPYINSQPVPQSPGISPTQGARPIAPPLESSSHSDTERPPVRRTYAPYINSQPVPQSPGISPRQGARPIASPLEGSSHSAQRTSTPYTNTQPVPQSPGTSSRQGARPIASPLEGSSHRSYSNTESPLAQRVSAPYPNTQPVPQGLGISPRLQPAVFPALQAPAGYSDHESPEEIETNLPCD